MEGSAKRSIPTEEVSESYLEEVDHAILNAQCKKFKPTGQRVYAVAKGRTTGLFNTWKECEASVSRFSGAVHKSFASVGEANQWLDESLHQVPITSDMTVVYIDGACKDNQAGIGVWFGDNGERNLSESLVGKQTNQRAELTALIRVLEVAPNEPLHVLSDSEYCVSGVNYRRKEWARNNFANVQNPDLWQRILALLNSRQHPLALRHVVGHSGNRGNDMAHRLAVAGMQ